MLVLLLAWLAGSLDLVALGHPVFLISALFAASFTIALAFDLLRRWLRTRRG
jgi:type IV secretory pathway VirB2 component (pilin)